MVTISLHIYCGFLAEKSKINKRKYVILHNEKNENIIL